MTFVPLVNSCAGGRLSLPLLLSFVMCSPQDTHAAAACCVPEDSNSIEDAAAQCSEHLHMRCPSLFGLYPRSASANEWENRMPESESGISVPVGCNGVLDAAGQDIGIL